MLDEGVGSVLLQALARRVAVSHVDLPMSDAKVRVADVDFAEVERLRERLLVAQVVAAFQALDQGLIGDVLEADDSALQAGFPAWTGGPLSYAYFDGLANFVSRADALAAEHGQTFVLPASVRQRAAAGAAYEQ
ncbi:hypothetical protein D9M68_726460 [compost metagenome]